MNLYMFFLHIIYNHELKEDNMKYDCIIIGAGLSGLTAASLLAKRGLSVAVCEQASKPGGSCGIFKRQIDEKQVVFDQGASKFLGFGTNGFDAHRFLFNCLEEPFHVVRHGNIYEDLLSIFPDQSISIERFYDDMTNDKTVLFLGIIDFLKHPVTCIKFLSYLNSSADKLLRKYFTDKNILKFFDKLTSTYFFAALENVPVIPSFVMLVKNYVSGSWYPAGSSLFLPGVLEKVIEENNGHMYYDTMVKEIMFNNKKHTLSDLIRCHAKGVILDNDDVLLSDNVIFSGTVWDLYSKLLPKHIVTDEMLAWIDSQEPTHSSVVLYMLVNKTAVPDDACTIEMLASSTGNIDENEVTVHIPSLDDRTLCDEDSHIIIAVVPSFINWGTVKELNESTDHRDSRFFNTYSEDYYQEQKARETERIISLMVKRFPDLKENIKYSELATPFTIERYTMKKNGSTAGPKQKPGQYIFNRQSIKTAWPGLYCCGESTVMGTGAAAVTVSGITAANTVLKKSNKPCYVWNKNMDDYVIELELPIETDWIARHYPADEAKIMSKASECLYCEHPSCCSKKLLDIPGIMRRASCSNFKGAFDIIDNAYIKINENFIKDCETSCMRNVDFSGVFSYLLKRSTSFS